jgi:hypothetical protein
MIKNTFKLTAIALAGAFLMATASCGHAYMCPTYSKSKLKNDKDHHGMMRSVVRAI